MSKKLLSLTMTVLLVLAVEAAAQMREVDIFYDRDGREIMLDALTGEVLAIREPHGAFPRADREPPPRMRHERRMEDVSRYRDRQPGYRDYRRLPEPAYPEDDYLYEDDYARDDPWYEPPAWEEQPPRFGPREDVDRRPLDDPAVAAVPDPQPAPGTVIEEQPRVLPDVTQQPEVGSAGATDEIAKIQVLLDRAGASPGVIDGRIGDNVNKAIAAYRELTGETLRTYDQDYIDAKLAETGGDAFTTYEITAVDVAGPFVASVPNDYAEKALMERLGFVSVAEMLAERFHMDEKYLRALNPGVSFDRPGTLIKVANVGKPRTGKVERIIADKGRKQVRAYDADGRLVVAYPATIGSASTPSPTGTHTVERIAINPEYTYNPRVNFQQGENTRVLTIPPGPNGPVGTVWIGLSKPTYGIHGTPEPSKIGKTESNGCIRLTNWDAQELAKLVSAGVTVEFAE